MASGRIYRADVPDKRLYLTGLKSVQSIHAVRVSSAPTKAADRRNDVARAAGEKQTGQSGHLDRQAARRKALPAGDGRHCQQIRPDHLGTPNETRGIPAAGRLILP